MLWVYQFMGNPQSAASLFETIIFLLRISVIYGQFHSFVRASVMGTSTEDQAENQTVVCIEMAKGSKTEGVKFQCKNRCIMHIHSI